MRAAIKKSLLTLTAASILSIVVIPTVSARQVGGGAGMAQNSTDAACFTHQNGVVFNTCGTTSTKAYEVHLETDSAGPKVVSFAGTGAVACNSNSNDAWGNSFSNSPALTTPQFSILVKTLASVNVPSPGYLWLRCDFPGTGYLTQVTWAP